MLRLKAGDGDEHEDEASRAICESHRHPDPKSALANLRGEQIANFGEEPPLTCGKGKENQNAQQI